MTSDAETIAALRAENAKLREELRLLKIENNTVHKFCALLSENYDRLVASTSKKSRKP